MAKVTAGCDQLGDFAPEFAQLNDEVLQAWAAFRMAKEEKRIYETESRGIF